MLLVRAALLEEVIFELRSLQERNHAQIHGQSVPEGKTKADDRWIK